MYSKPAVVRIIDGISGQYVLSLRKTKRLLSTSPYRPGSGFSLSSNGYIGTNAHVVSTTHDGEDKASETPCY
jgi:S1-C subfamily serine protease